MKTESIEFALSAIQEIYPTIDWNNQNISEKIVNSIEEVIEEIEETWDKNEVPHDIFWEIAKRYIS